MNREAWQATVHGVTRVRHDLATKPQPPFPPLLPESQEIEGVIKDGSGNQDLVPYRML